MDHDIEANDSIPRSPVGGTVSEDHGRIENDLSQFQPRRLVRSLRHYERVLVIAESELERKRAVSAKVRAWQIWNQRRRKSVTLRILNAFHLSRRPELPHLDELASLVKHFFPQRSEIKATICDIGPDHFSTFDRKLGDIDIEKDFGSKSTDASVRWIHIPVGSGLLSSSIADMFLNAGPSDEIAGSTLLDQEPLPSMRFEVVNIRERDYLQDQVNQYNLVKQNLARTLHLDKELWTGFANELPMDCEWRAQHNGTQTSFCKIVRSDMPWHLVDDVYSDISFANTGLKRSYEPQFLSRGAYSNSILVRDTFECYWRGSGFLLTMSQLAGVSYLDRDLSAALLATPRAGLERREWHVMEYVRHALQVESHRQNLRPHDVQSILKILIVELHETPHNLRNGGIPELHSMYVPVVRDLKARSNMPSRRNESVSLVREFVACINEISLLKESEEQKLAILSLWSDRWKTLLGSDTIPRAQTENDIKYFETAIKNVTARHQKLSRLLTDLRNSLEVMFQLKTIEQNELALKADSNSKAIILFTVITIIFLPLSFFTSYFGMNLQGVINTDKNERYFWTVSGSATVAIVTMTVLLAFKDQLYTWVRTDKDHPKSQRRPASLNQDNTADPWLL